MAENLQYEAPENIFLPGGTIMLGQWNVQDLDTYGLDWNYHGYLDEIRVWSQRLGSSDINDLLFSYVPASTDGLVHYWRFNDGDGDTAVDLVDGRFDSDLQLQTAPNRVPLWEASTTSVEFPSGDTLSTYNLVNNYDVTDPFYNVTRDFCDDAVGVLGNPPCEMDESMRLYYNTECRLNSLLFGDTAFAMEVLEQATRDCAYMLGVDSLEAEEVYLEFAQQCNAFDGRHFSLASGSNCDLQCPGSRCVDDGSCVCFDGFWGDTCENTCPSFEGMPCGPGTCDPVDGTCSCPGNYQEETDCSTCNPGWYGSECSVAAASVSSSSTHNLAMLTGRSHIVNLEGVGFSMQVPGEYTLLTHSSWNIHVRQIPCGNNGATCVNQVWIESGGNNFVVHGVYPNEEFPVIFLNDDESWFASLGALSGTEGAVTVVKETVSSFVFSHSQGHRVTVKALGSYLNILIEMLGAYCGQYGGIVGNCDGNLNNDFADGSGNVALQDITGSWIVGDFATHHAVSGTSGFIYMRVAEVLGETLLHIEPLNMDSLATYGLYLDAADPVQSAAQLVNFDVTRDVTIEMKLKPTLTSDGGAGGVLWSYSNVDRVSLSTDGGVVALHVAGTSLDTGLPVAEGEWNHIALMFSRETEVAQIYVIYQNMTAEATSLDLSGYDVFVPGGLLSIAGEIPRSGEDSSLLLPQTLVALVDEFRVWTTTHDVTTLMQNVEFDVSGFPGLATYWTFSEGTGHATVDVINDYQLDIPRSGAVWQISDVSLQTPPVVTSEDPYQFSESYEVGESTCADTASDDDTTSSESDDICTHLFNQSPLATTCGSLPAILDLFEVICSLDIAAAPGSADVIYETMADSFAWYCTETLEPSDDPTLTLCADEEYVELLGERPMCVQGSSCRFGQVVDDECRCDLGYYGDECSQVCPGGASNPCHGNGLCDMVTGECGCQSGFDPDTNCEDCADGFVGENCDEYEPSNPPTSTSRTCSVFGVGHVDDFRDVVRVVSVKDNLLVWQSGSDAIFVRSQACYGGGVCFSAVSFVFGGETLVIRAPYNSGAYAFVWHDDDVSDEQTSITFANTQLTMTRESPFEYHVTTSDVTAIVRVFRLSLGVTIFTENEGDVTDALCGGFSASYSSLADVLASETTAFDPVFENNVFGETETQGGAGCSLRFDGTLASSDPVPESLFSLGSSITFFAYVKPTSLQGVLFSYSHHTTFTVYLDDVIVVQIGNTHYVTPLDLQVDEWAQIAVTLQGSSGSFTVLKKDDIFAYESVSQQAPATVDMFQHGGVFSLGMFTPVLDTASISDVFDTPFRGEMDEVRIYKRSFSIAEASSQFNAHTTNLIDLAAWWRFDECDGLYLQDSWTNRIELQVEKYSWTDPEPQWRISEADIPLTDSTTDFSFPDTATAEAAQEFCARLLSDVYSACSLSGERESLYTTTMCERHVAATGSQVDTLMVLLAAADQCYLQEDLTQHPSRNSCTIFAGSSAETFFPQYSGPDCDVRCVYGYYDEEQDTQCACA